MDKCPVCGELKAQPGYVCPDCRAEIFAGGNIALSDETKAALLKQTRDFCIEKSIERMMVRGSSA